MNTFFDDIDLDNGRDLAFELVELLKKKNLKIGFAESCTGGLISAGIVDIPGASDVFYGSIVSYDNSIKEKCLGVSKEVLETKGAVSYECAMMMAEGARKALDTDIAVSVTGIAGPGGGTAEKPVGTVFIGYSDKDGSESIVTFSEGDRNEIRKVTCFKAYKYALSKLTI